MYIRLILSVSADSPQILLNPVNTAAFKGSDARFNCTAALWGTDDAILWSYIAMNGGTEQRIYNSIDGEFVTHRFCCEFAGGLTYRRATSITSTSTVRTPIATPLFYMYCL